MNTLNYCKYVIKFDWQEKFNKKILTFSIILLQVLAHETCHVFYLAHCVFYDCLMNESSSVTEAITQPLFLCPICIRKLQKVCKFDILKRYKSMLDFLISINTDQSSVHLKNSIDWLQEFLQWTNKRERTWLEIYNRANMSVVENTPTGQDLELQYSNSLLN